MIYLLKKILTKDECVFLTNLFDKEKKTTASLDNCNHSGTKFSYGFIPSYEFDIYLTKLKPKILKYFIELGNMQIPLSDLSNVNTYVREYNNNSFLKKHVDRKDISVTMSICIYSNINKTWPLCANINGNDYCLDANIGDGILLFDADKNTHWRDTLECNKNERVVQFFLHWQPVFNPIKNTKSLL